jgi:ADP-heptose:LPS heptosyltransferase
MCKALKVNLPEAKISLIARTYTKPVLENCPEIDKVFFIDEYSKGIKEIFKLEKFDAVFFPRPRLNECLSAYFARIPLRVGTAYRYYSFLFNHKVYDHRKTAEYHEAEYNTRLIASVLEKPVETSLVKPYINPKALEQVKNILKEKGMDFNQPFIIIHPGSGGSSRNWSAENFGKAANIISKEKNIKIIISGTIEEKTQCEKAFSFCPYALNLCGLFSLNQLIALISQTKLLIANSTGVLHIAAALDIPVIGLYPNSPHLSAKRWGPYSKNSIKISPPISVNRDEIDNMSLISVYEVVNSTTKLLE